MGDSISEGVVESYVKSKSLNKDKYDWSGYLHLDLYRCWRLRRS